MELHIGGLVTKTSDVKMTGPQAKADPTLNKCIPCRDQGYIEVAVSVVQI